MPVPPSMVSSEVIVLMTPPMPVAVELTRTVSSSEPVNTASGPETVRMMTRSAPSLVRITVGRLGPAWVLSTVRVSAPEPRAIVRSSTAR